MVVFGLGFLACYTILINPNWYKGLGLGDVTMSPKECERIVREIEKYDWDTKVATAVMKAESKCNVNARGDTEPEYIFEENGRQYGYSVGAFQVRILPGREACDTYDLATNVKCAYEIYDKDGRNFTPWTMFINGKYLDYME